MKENNHICVEYEIPKIPWAIHSSFVKEKQQMLKKRNIPFPFYPKLFLLSISRSSWSSIRKNIPYKILAIGNCSVEIFGCSVEVLIPWEVMTSSKMIFQFQEII